MAATPLVPFRSDEYGFAATFPGPLRQIPLSQTIGAIQVTGRIFTAGPDDDGFAVAAVQIPAGTPFDADQAVAAAVRGAAATSGGTISNQHTETFQGHPAQVATITSAKNSMMIEESSADNRLYTLVAPPNEFGQLHDSFQLLP